MAEPLDDGEWLSRHDPAAVAVQELDEDDTHASGVEPTKRADAHEPELVALGGPCPICLQDLDGPVMVQGCFHVYCRRCLNHWSANLALHGLARPTCPLCKRAFDTIYADVVSETSYTLLRFNGVRFALGGSRQPQQQWTADEGFLRREMVYRRRLRLVRVQDQVVPVNWMVSPPRRLKRKGQYEQWQRRELTACVGRGVDLTVLLALLDGILEPTGRPQPLVDSLGALDATLEPYLQDDTPTFVRELAFFMASRLNIQAYDRVVAYCCPQPSADCGLPECGAAIQTTTTTR